MPRYVVLEHDHPELHWDFMLESDGILRTWRLETPPGDECEIRAQQLSDHRLHYLDYEGPVSGDRGKVSRWDAGDYESVEAVPDRLEVEFCGGKLRGRAMLTRIGGGSVADDWSVVFVAG